MRGEVVEQNPEDEPAGELLKRIEKGKAALSQMRSGLPITEKAEWPDLILPRGWAIATLGGLALKITDGTHKTPTYVSEGVPFISVKDLAVDGSTSQTQDLFHKRSMHYSINGVTLAEEIF